MKCKKCKEACKKAGKQKNGMQKWFCRACQKYQQKQYVYRAYDSSTNQQLIALLKEGCGIRSIARLLQISCTTVINRIKTISKKIIPPSIKLRKEYEVDEMRTFVQKKTRLLWVAYAMQRDTGEVISFNVGRRTNKTLKVITDTLQLSDAKRVYTDRLNCYKTLINKKVHTFKKRATNHIERNHLTIRTHLKRLNRRTICFSKSVSMLTACLRIYFWA